LTRNSNTRNVSLAVCWGTWSYSGVITHIHWWSYNSQIISF